VCNVHIKFNTMKTAITSLEVGLLTVAAAAIIFVTFIVWPSIFVAAIDHRVWPSLSLFVADILVAFIFEAVNFCGCH